MENISYIGLSQQLAIQQQMNMVANNMANMSTPGYKTQNALFTDYMTMSKDKGGVNQVLNATSYRDLSAGPMTQTYNPFDIAIQGEGYFAVETPQGVKYTRDGSFSMNTNRELVDKAGNKVMGDGGPISFPPEASNMKISADGSISGSTGALGRIKVVTLDNPQAMERGGDNLFSLKDAKEKPVENLKIVQGALEGSNVNPVLEMNRMIELLRMFQSTQKMLQNDHEMARTMIDKLTKV
jgi:flagellar basal-body rod protein FlgF